MKNSFNYIHFKNGIRHYRLLIPNGIRANDYWEKYDSTNLDIIGTALGWDYKNICDIGHKSGVICNGPDFKVWLHCFAPKLRMARIFEMINIRVAVKYEF